MNNEIEKFNDLIDEIKDIEEYEKKKTNIINKNIDHNIDTIQRHYKVKIYFILCLLLYVYI